MSGIDADTFEQELRAAGYEDVSVAGFPAGHDLDEHEHSYDLRAVVTAGEFVIGVGGRERSYRVGDVFEFARGTRHVERTGPDGVAFVIGRHH